MIFRQVLMHSLVGLAKSILLMKCSTMVVFYSGDSMKRKFNQQRKAPNLENNTENVAFLQLVENATRGDSEAISALCAEIAKDVLFRTTHLLSNRSDAEDVAQETLLRVCKNIRQLKDPKAFRKWLSSIVLNEARRQMMQNAKQWNILYLSEELESAPEDNDDFLPETYVENEENRRAVIEPIDELPLRQREAIVLHYYDRLNVSETAEVMGIPQPSVSLYLKHARNKIKAKLENRASSITRSVHGITYLPVGLALTRVLSAEGTAFTPATSAWLPEVLAKCFETAKITTFSVTESSSTAISLKGSATASTILKTSLITAISLVTSIAITLIAALSTPANGDFMQNEPILAVGEIIFTGGNTDLPYLNPKNAKAVTDSAFGELSMLNWKITAMGSEDAIYPVGGDLSSTSSIFDKMKADGMYGEYMLVYLMKAANGDTYKLGHSFIIHTVDS
jgi:RNA polymerase sigma-70 factor (ECF subfamily)